MVTDAKFDELKDKVERMEIVLALYAELLDKQCERNETFADALKAIKIVLVQHHTELYSVAQQTAVKRNETIN